MVGIDLHRQRSVIVRMTEDGRKLETVRITNSPAALRREIAKAGKNPRVVIGRFRARPDCPRASPGQPHRTVKDRMSDPLSMRSPH
jgi:hypothetical protein